MIAKIILVVLLLFPSISCAWDGEVYFGALLDSTVRAQPRGWTSAQFASGVEVGHLVFDVVRPYVKLDTLMDDYNNNGSFHPASIRYTIGIGARIWEGLHADFSRMCWHTIDGPGTEEAWIIKLSYKWGKK